MDINRSMRMTVTLYHYPVSKNNFLTVVLPFNQQQIFKSLFKPRVQDAIEVKRNTEQVFP